MKTTCFVCRISRLVVSSVDFVQLIENGVAFWAFHLVDFVQLGRFCPSFSALGLGFEGLRVQKKDTVCIIGGCY